MAIGRRRKKRLTDRWLWAVVALLIMWGGYQAWRVHRQIVGQVRHQQEHQRRSIDSLPVGGDRVSASKMDISRNKPLIRHPHTAAGSVPLTPSEMDQVHQLFRQGIALADAHHLIAARTALERAWHMTAGYRTPEFNSIGRWLAKINTHTLLSGVAYPGDHWVRLIQVAPGARLASIAHLYRITIQMLLDLNPMIQPRDMQAGSWLLVILGPFNADIELSHRRVDILLHHQFVLNYRFKYTGVITPAPGEYAVARTSYTALAAGAAELMSLTLAGEINGTRETVKISNIASPNVDMVMPTRALAELIKMLSRRFSVVTIRS